MNDGGNNIYYFERVPAAAMPPPPMAIDGYPMADGDLGRTEEPSGY